MNLQKHNSHQELQSEDPMLYKVLLFNEIYGKQIFSSLLAPEELVGQWKFEATQRFSNMSTLNREEK